MREAETSIQRDYTKVQKDPRKRTCEREKLGDPEKQKTLKETEKHRGLKPRNTQNKKYAE